MEGVDRTVQAMTSYPEMRKLKKKKKLLQDDLPASSWAMLVECLYSVPKNRDKSVNHLDFICRVAKCIFLNHQTPYTAVNRAGRHAVGAVNPERLTGCHLMNYIPPNKKKKSQHLQGCAWFIFPSEMSVKRKSKRKPGSTALIGEKKIWPHKSKKNTFLKLNILKYPQPPSACVRRHTHPKWRRHT